MRRERMTLLRLRGASDWEQIERTAIVLTGHPRQQKWWPSVLISLERYPGPLVLAYDDVDTSAIPPDVLERFSAVAVTGYPAGELGQSRGELVCLRIGFAAAAGLDIDYCLKLGFDEPPWRWRNIVLLIAELNADKLDCIDCETRIIFGRPEHFSKAMEGFAIAGHKGGSAESYWTGTLARLKVRRKRIDERLWWQQRLGLLHLQGEYAANMGKPNAWSWTIGEIWPRSEASDD